MHGREAGWRLQRSCTPSGDGEEATRGWFNPSLCGPACLALGAILSTVSWGSLPNLLPVCSRRQLWTLTRVGATGVGAANPITAPAGFLGGLAHLRIMLVGCVAPDLQRVPGGTAGLQMMITRRRSGWGTGCIQLGEHLPRASTTHYHD